MFGLMKNKSCTSANQEHWYRLHYCGLCKTIGSRYDQKSRLFLNFDLVFMAEILSHINQSRPENWSPEFQSQKCFQLPSESNTPIHMQYVADINVLLAQTKVRDNQQDDVSLVWSAVGEIFSGSFNKMNERMERWSLDKEFLDNLLLENNNRERNLHHPSNKTEEMVAWYAAPSAEMTAYLFAKGLRDEQTKEWKNHFSKIGYGFGELTYALDAWRDIQKDREEENFNVLLINEIPVGQAKKSLEDWIWSRADNIIELINHSSLEPHLKQNIVARLTMNLSSALGVEHHCQTVNQGIAESTVPVLISKISDTLNSIANWLNPLRPSKFIVSYLVLVFLFFHEYLFAVGKMIQSPAQSLSHYGLLAGIISLPFISYFIFKKVAEDDKKGGRKRKRLAARLKRKLKRMERRAAKGKGEGGLKTWHWVLIILGGLFLIGLLAGSSANCGGGNGCNADCSSGGGGCGDGCGDGCSSGCNSSCG